MLRTAIITLLSFITLTAVAIDIDTAPIDSFISHIERNNQGIGTVMIAHKDTIIYNRDFGKHTVAPDNGNYRIGSITKLFTATIIHNLCSENKLSLNTTLHNFFPQIPASDLITIQQLLSHTSGLADYTIKQDTLPLWLTTPATQQEIMNEIVRQDTIFTPGTALRYSNTAYYLLGSIIEQIYHKTYSEVVDSLIIKPLHLNNTQSGIADPSAAATPYKLNTANRWQAVEDFYFPNVTAVGDIISSPTDLITFIQALFNGNLVDNNALQLMIPQDDQPFGCGMMIMPFYEHTFYGHAGDTYGTNTAIMYNQQDSITIAICINGCSTSRNDLLIGICSAIYDSYYEFPDFSDLQQYTASVDELKQYAGIFTSDIINLPIHIEFDPSDNNLSLRLQGQPAIWLQAKAPGIFVNTMTGVGIAFKDKDHLTFRQFQALIRLTRQQ